MCANNDVTRGSAHARLVIIPTWLDIALSMLALNCGGWKESGASCGVAGCP
jgi:hypothetical protein